MERTDSWQIQYIVSNQAPSAVKTVAVVTGASLSVYIEGIGKCTNGKKYNMLSTCKENTTLLHTLRCGSSQVPCRSKLGCLALCSSFSNVPHLPDDMTGGFLMLFLGCFLLWWPLGLARGDFCVLLLDPPASEHWGFVSSSSISSTSSSSSVPCCWWDTLDGSV